MSSRWIVKCKNCGAEITFQFVDEQYPREAVKQVTALPPKPAIRNHSEPLKCPLCKVIADYTRVDLQFRSG